jgi:enoyl-CoA hydratase/carnithine racemase
MLLRVNNDLLYRTGGYQVMESSDAVLLEKQGAVALIRFNRPERLNAWGADLAAGFLDALSIAEKDKDICGVAITGNGRAFSAGADLKNPQTHSVESVEEYLSSQRSMPVFDIVSKFPKPIISAVNGYAIGIGCLVPLCCDFIVATEHAQFCLPQVSLGILPAYGGTLRLARHVGSGNAMDMILTARKVSGREALRMGIVSRLLAADSLVEDAVSIMAQIADMPPNSVQLARESLRHGYDSSMEATERADMFRHLALSQTADRAARHQAWRDREPKPLRPR